LKKKNRNKVPGGTPGNFKNFVYTQKDGILAVQGLSS